MQWWRVVGAIGRFMMRAGVLVLLFVAYQLWGTGLATSQAQDRLEDQFRAQLETTTSTTSTTAATVPDPATTVPTTAPDELPPMAPGDPVGRIRIPAIGVDWIAVQGVAIADLKEGPGHFPQSPLPGQPGNSAFAGHRTTYGAPFARLDELQPGDEMVFETVQGTFTYRVDAHPAGEGEPPAGHFIVAPTAIEVLDDDGTNRVTLVACHPKYSARQRIVVTGTLETPPAPPTPIAQEVDEDIVTIDASIDDLASGDTSARAPAVLWSLLALAVWFATWWAARWWAARDRAGETGRTVWWHRVLPYVVGTPVFLVVLFVAYENIARLLPAAY